MGKKQKYMTLWDQSKGTPPDLNTIPLPGGGIPPIIGECVEQEMDKKRAHTMIYCFTLINLQRQPVAINSV